MPYDFSLVIDAGHGGRDPGTTAGGLIEKNIALSVVLQLCSLLSSDLKSVQPTRVRDDFVSLGERVLVANRYGAAGSWLLSIHVNSQIIVPGRAPARGCEVHLYSLGSPIVRSLASDLLASVARSGIPYSPRGIKTHGKWNPGTVLSPRFYVLRKTRQPAILIELGYASHPDDAKILRSLEWQARVSKELAVAVVNWCRRWQSIV